MEYTDLKHLREEWLQGNFKYPDEMQVAGITYKKRPVADSDETPNIEDIVVRGAKAYIIYQTSILHKDEAKEKGMHQWIVFVWGVTDKSIIRPYDVRSVSPNRFMPRVMEQQERIGDVVLLKVFLPSGAGAIKGKVDTGAEISSLHADDIKVMNGTVKFINKDLSQNVISVPVAEKQAVKSADGGVEYRPVIELDIEVNDKPVRGVLFNLNNRDQMEYPCLVGQNVLEKTNFLVDPKQDDPEVQDQFEDEWVEDPEIDLTLLNEEFKDIERVVIEEDDYNEKAKVLYETLEEIDITFQDFIRWVRTESRKVMKDIEY